MPHEAGSPAPAWLSGSVSVSVVRSSVGLPPWTRSSGREAVARAARVGDESGEGKGVRSRVARASRKPDESEVGVLEAWETLRPPTSKESHSALVPYRIGSQSSDKVPVSTAYWVAVG